MDMDSIHAAIGRVIMDFLIFIFFGGGVIICYIYLILSHNFSRHTHSLNKHTRQSINCDDITC